MLKDLLFVFAVAYIRAGEYFINECLTRTTTAWLYSVYTFVLYAAIWFHFGFINLLLFLITLFIVSAAFGALTLIYINSRRAS